MSRKPHAPQRAILSFLMTAGVTLALSGINAPQPAFGQATGAASQAPTGHRQPGANDVKRDGSADQGVGTTPELQDKEKDVDQKVKSICRGC
jgi:hypothetical protein